LDNDLLSALPDAAIAVDAGNIVLSANTHAHQVLQSALVGLHLTSLIRSTVFANLISTVRRSGEPAAMELDLPSRPPRMFAVHVAPIRHNGRLLVLLRDMTREQRVERMRSDFVAHASHEMRTPLASIIGMIETLQGAAKDDTTARERFLGTMLAQANRMRRLIDDLLTLSRIELNEHVQPNDKISLADVARQAKANLAAQAKAAGVDVTITGSGQPIVAGNGDELLQVAQNLLENAIKYGAGGGQIHIEIAVDGNNGLLGVRDFGKGIDDIHLPRLTERFYRVNTQESRAAGGTGLGLAIVKHIVSRHRGKLSITSAAGRGSTFSVSIPLYKS
jgi:two-component system phosphate regulon sensor histidine kinase PhoR